MYWSREIMTKLLENIDILKEKIKYYRALLNELLQKQTLKEKIKVLDKTIEVHNFFSILEKNIFINLTLEQLFIIKILIVSGQSEILINDAKDLNLQKIVCLIDILLKVERFYDSIGGILGYHTTVLELLYAQLKNIDTDKDIEHYSHPKMIDIIQETPYVSYLNRRGIESIHMIGEMYPIGGAGDRLHLIDQMTGELLPVAMLPFLGRSLLEGMIRDTQAREYLYYQLYGDSICTPIAIMTSLEKNNRKYIENLLEQKNHFNRPKNSYQIFDQPLVPVVSEYGTWVIKDFHELTLKPGGHGVLWKQALDEGIFDWFKTLNKTKLLIRQINNPIASTDYGILSLLGYGIDNDKAYGVLSCKRLVHSPEGMNVFCERETNYGYEYGITNIEYTEFSKKGIEDRPVEENGLFSVYPSNTNILFVDIESVIEAVKINPIPGMIINMKTEFTHLNSKGEPEGVLGGRLESTMQNIVDVMFDKFPVRQEIIDQKDLKTFLLFNERHKTISVTKNRFKGFHQLEGTPFHSHYTLLKNYHDLLKNYCNIIVPEFCSFKEYIEFGPNFIVDLHPAIGPLWRIISQKINGGEIFDHSELILEIANLEIKDFYLRGSFLIQSNDPMGIKFSESKLNYSHYGGRCTLYNVKIINNGINKSYRNVYWSNEIKRKESFTLILHGNSEFYAKNVNFEGNYLIEVEDGFVVEAYDHRGKVKFKKKKINEPRWIWNYHYDENNQIILRKRNL